jgi:hypothetical protein
MVLLSTPNIYNVFDNHHMLWMGIWIHHHAITISQASQKLGTKSAEIPGHSLVMNEAFVQWLRLQTHLEWFLLPS